MQSRASDDRRVVGRSVAGRRAIGRVSPRPRPRGRSPPSCRPGRRRGRPWRSSGSTSAARPARASPARVSSIAFTAARIGWLARMTRLKPLAYSSSEVNVGNSVGTATRGTEPRPFQQPRKPSISARVLSSRVDQDRVGAGLDVGVGAGAGVLDAVTGDQALDPGDEHEPVAVLEALGRPDPAGLLVARDQLALRLAGVQAVALREQVVLDRDRRDPGPLVLDERPDDVAQAAEPVVDVGDDRAARWRRRSGRRRPRVSVIVVRLRSGSAWAIVATPKPLTQTASKPYEPMSFALSASWAPTATTARGSLQRARAAPPACDPPGSCRRSVGGLVHDRFLPGPGRPRRRSRRPPDRSRAGRRRSTRRHAG